MSKSFEYKVAPPAPPVSEAEKVAPVELRACDVCRLVDGDETPKQCSYCGFCESWICKDCSPNVIKRAKAAALKLAGK